MEKIRRSCSGCLLQKTADKSRLTTSGQQHKLVCMKMRDQAPVVVAALLLSALAYAQEPVKPAADVESLFKDKNKKLNEMKQVAYHIEKDLLQCNHWDEADKWRDQSQGFETRGVHHDMVRHVEDGGRQSGRALGSGDEAVGVRVPRRMDASRVRGKLLKSNEHRP